MTDSITLPRGEFAACQKAVEYGKDECARLTSERDGAYADRDQALRSAEAERAARTRAHALVETVREHLAGEVSRSAVTIALAQYDAALREIGELFPPPATESAVEAIADRALRVVGRLKRLGGE